MKYLFIILVTIYSLETYCQDSTSALKNQLHFKTFSGFRKDGKKISMGEFKTEIYKVPAAIPIYKKAARNYTFSYVSGASMSTFMLLSRRASNNSSAGFGKRKTGFVIAGIVSMGAFYYLHFRSNKQLKQAAKIHNEAPPLSY